MANHGIGQGVDNIYEVFFPTHNKYMTKQKVELDFSQYWFRIKLNKFNSI